MSLRQLFPFARRIVAGAGLLLSPRDSLPQSMFATAFAALADSPASPPERPARTMTIMVTPTDGTTLTSSSIGSLEIVWCDPSYTMSSHTVTWQGHTLTGESTSVPYRAGCNYSITSTFSSITVDPTRPLTLVAAATDQYGHITSTTVTYTLSPSAVRLDITPVATQLITLRRGAPDSTAFTITNPGTVAVSVALSSTCGTMPSCSPALSSATIPAGGSQSVMVRFVAPTTYATTNDVALNATITMNGQSSTRTGISSTTTPIAEPWVTPHASAGTGAIVAGGQTATVSFTVGATPSNNWGTFTVDIRCATSGWSCGADFSEISVPPSGRSLPVSVWVPQVVGGATTPPTPITLVASLWDGTKLLAADTGVIQARLAYHTPRLSPKSTAANVGNGVPHTDSFTLTNTGNAAATYTLAGVCGSLAANGCTTNVPSITLAPGASGNVSVSYTPPTSGAVSGTVKLIAKYQVAAPAESDTASVVVTSGDVNPPTMTVAPPEGAVLTTRAVNAVVSVCDSDGIVGQPTLTANGSTVSGSFASAPQSGCATAGSTTFGVTAQPGSNTLVATVSDGVHTTTTTRTFVYDEAVEMTPAVVAVTPPRTRGAQTASADTFTVRNPGSLSATYAVASACTTGVSGCSSSQSSVVVDAGQTTTVVVSFTAGATSGNATVSLSATITGVTGHAITSSASASVVVDATPPTIAISPTGVVTAVSPPTITIQWCDAEGALTAHSVTLDGVALPDVFAASTTAGCAAAGTSTYSGLSMAPGPHSIGTSATDAVGHVTTTDANITFALPALSDFRPDVTPKSASIDVFAGVTVQRTFTVRNAGVASALYQLNAYCPSITCQISKTSATLAPGARDSAVVTFTPTSSMSPSATVGMRATYSNAASQTIADTGTVDRRARANGVACRSLDHAVHADNDGRAGHAHGLLLRTSKHRHARGDVRFHVSHRRRIHLAAGMGGLQR